MASFQGIKAVFFDWDYTLVQNDLPGAIARVSHRLEDWIERADYGAVRECIPEADRRKREECGDSAFEDLYSSLLCFARYKLDVRQYSRDEWWGQYYETVEHKTLSRERCAELSGIFWETFPGDLELGTTEVLQRLKARGLRLVLITNDDGVPGIKRARLAKVPWGLYFDLCLAGGDGILYDWHNPAGDPHHTFPNKRAPHMFEYALRALGLEAREAIMVGDKLDSDLRPAHALGMGAVLVTPDQVPADPALPEWCAQIRSPQELESLLPEPLGQETYPSSSDLLTGLVYALQVYEDMKAKERRLLKRSPNVPPPQYAYRTALYDCPSMRARVERVLSERLLSPKLVARRSDLARERIADDWGLMTVYASRSEAARRFLESYLEAHRVDRHGRMQAFRDAQREITACMDKASRYSVRYQRLLIALSMTEYFPGEAVEMADRLLEDDRTDVFPHSMWRDREHAFRQETRDAQGCTAYHVNVTGQTTWATELVSDAVSKGESVCCFVTSPRVQSHRALGDLSHEYRVPRVLIPSADPLQFVESEDGYAVDYVRRLAQLRTMVEKLVDLSPQKTDRAKLRGLLVRRFDVQELSYLCLDLGIDYENLRGEGRTAKAVELIGYCDRHDLIPKLIATGRQIRPRASWDEVSGPAKLRLFFFVDRYPQVSLRLIAHPVYPFLQLFPGCLDMANNLYRFCVEVRNPDIAARFTKAMKAQINHGLPGNRVEEFPLDREEYEELEEECTQELAQFLNVHGVRRIDPETAQAICDAVSAPEDAVKRIIERTNDALSALR